MSTESLQEITYQTTTNCDWEPPLPPTDLIFDDGEPLESNRHRIAMNTLIESIHEYLKEREDFFVGGNMFIYYSSSQVRNRDFRGPDFFVVLNVDGKKDRQGWVVWEENGRYPDVIIELMSPSTSAEDIGTKKEIYQETFRTPDYFVYDPFNPDSLQGWHLNENQEYQALTSNERGWLWCQKLGLWVGTWSGTLLRETAQWLRFYDTDSNLILLPEEAAKKQLEETQQQLELTQRQLETIEQQALKQGALRQLLRMLTTRFGQIPPQFELRLQELNTHQLEDLVEVVLTVNSIEELLNQNPFV